MVRRRGVLSLSFIEMLVVAFLIAALFALLLPSLGPVREAARRHSCMNNLRQIGLAIKSYENVFECFPLGTANATGPVANLPVGYHHNWMIALLPQLELRAYADAINADLGVYDPANATVRSMRIAVLLCPSDSMAQGSIPTTSSYAGAYHDREAPIDVTNNGLFRLNRPWRHEQIRDGSSHTIAVGEKLDDGADLGWMSGTRATLRNGGPLISTRRTRLEPFEPGALAEDDPILSTVPELLNGSFWSRHPAGANFCFADGSTRFLRLPLGGPGYQSLIHPADGDPDPGAGL